MLKSPKLSNSQSLDCLALRIHDAIRTCLPGLDRLDAQLLLLHALGRNQTERAWLTTHDDRVLTDAEVHTYQVFCKRRLAGEPVAYIVGHKEFYGLDLLVDPRVLVPRPDTETLVEWALTLAQNIAFPLPNVNSAHVQRRALDLGTGSGAIALALKHQLPRWEISAIDASMDALAVARGNAQHLNLDIAFYQSSWFDAMQMMQPHQVFDIIVSNPPYIAEGDVHMTALKHEPKQALTSGADGLDDIRQLVAQAPRYLAPQGWLLLEHGYNQAAAVRELLIQQGFVQVQSKLDLAGIQRCSGGQWPIQG